MGTMRSVQISAIRNVKVMPTQEAGLKALIVSVKSTFVEQDRDSSINNLIVN